MKTSTCRYCPSQVIWTETVNGKSMCVDAYPVANGNVELLDEGDVVKSIVHGQPDMFGAERFVSHFATCPNADRARNSYTAFFLDSIFRNSELELPYGTYSA